MPRLLYFQTNFLPFLNLFRTDSAKVTACKTIMESFVDRSHEPFVNDSVILNNLMFAAKILHDSIRYVVKELTGPGDARLHKALESSQLFMIQLEQPYLVSTQVLRKFLQFSKIFRVLGIFT